MISEASASAKNCNSLSARLRVATWPHSRNKHVYNLVEKIVLVSTTNLPVHDNMTTSTAYSELHNSDSETCGWHHVYAILFTVTGVNTDSILHKELKHFSSCLEMTCEIKRKKSRNNRIIACKTQEELAMIYLNLRNCCSVSADSFCGLEMLSLMNRKTMDGCRFTFSDFFKMMYLKLCFITT